jgi:chromosome segregation ATPase
MNPRDRTRQALWSYAFFRFESAITIAATIILTGLSMAGVDWLPGKWWMWLAAGLVAETLLIYSTVTDKRALSDVSGKMLGQQFDLSAFRNKGVRERVAKALEYYHQIMQALQNGGGISGKLSELTNELEGWDKQVYKLGQHLDNYSQNPMITRDLEQVPKELRVLEVKLSQERQSDVKQELQTTFNSKAKQWQTLQNLNDTMEKAQLQLENTLSSLGTVYMQILNLGAKDMGTDDVKRLQETMHEQVLSLEDLSSAMDEVYKL